jgi:hypothetical protein
LTGTGADAYTRGLDGIHFIDNCARVGLPFSDRGGSIAEWEGGGFGRGIWRNGFANGVRPPRFGHAFIEGDDGLGGSVHGYVAVAFDSRDAAGWRNRRNYDFGEAPGSSLDQAACEHDDTTTGNCSRRSDIDIPRDGTGETGTAIGNAEQSQDRPEDDIAFEYTATAERYTEPATTGST